MSWVDVVIAWLAASVGFALGAWWRGITEHPQLKETDSSAERWLKGE